MVRLKDLLVVSARIPDGGRVRFGSTMLVASHGHDAPVEISGSARFGRLLGISPGMRELFSRLKRVAPTDSSVLIQGETGTGKELVAQAIHNASPRANHPFVVVDCASLPESLIEAELFGHDKGAFTGAVGPRPGAIEAADGGTVFLDEIGELPLSVQPKLLRALDTRSVRRIGETAHRAVNVRFLSATHRDLRAMMSTGSFRQDLYFRLAVIPLTIPPLRERVEDIPTLALHFQPPGANPLSPAVLAELARRPWLGNVRELRNFIERAVVLGLSEALASLGTKPDDTPVAPNGARGIPVLLDRPLREVRDACTDYVEREYVRGLLDRFSRNVNQVAAFAGVNRTYIYRLIRKHGL